MSKASKKNRTDPDGSAFLQAMDAVRRKHHPLILAAIKKDAEAAELTSKLRNLSDGGLNSPWFTVKQEGSVRSFQSSAKQAMFEEAQPIINAFLGLAPVPYRVP